MTWRPRVKHPSYGTNTRYFRTMQTAGVTSMSGFHI